MDNKILEILEILEIMGGTNVTPKEDIVETPQDKQALDTARKKRKSFNSIRYTKW